MLLSKQTELTQSVVLPIPFRNHEVTQKGKGKEYPSPVGQRVAFHAWSLAVESQLPLYPSGSLVIHMASETRHFQYRRLDRSSVRRFRRGDNVGQLDQGRIHNHRQSQNYCQIHRVNIYS